ncbi:MAG: nucleotidyltransferase [Candidatus Omnitrophota bacterium]
MVSQDYEDLFNTLNSYKIKYLVVGAHAVTFYTEPRFTKDLDVWIPPALNDAQHVHDALRAFGAPLKDITPLDFQNPKMILQIGVAPVRVDIMVDVPGVSVQKAWKNKVRARYGKTPIYILGLPELIQAKKAAGRPQDKLDLAKLVRKKPS